MDKASIARVVILIITAVNSILNLFHMETIPIEAGDAVGLLVFVGWSLYTAWKHNFLTKKGQAQKQVLEDNDLGQ